jgi:long-chain fatty acid transport protein
MYAPFALVCLIALTASLEARAGGFQSLEQGTPDIARAMVGTASVADSAATAWYSPAGMTRLAQPQLVNGVMGILGEARFDSDPQTTVSGTDGGNAAENSIAPGGLFYVHPLEERWAVGFSATAPFVGTLDYGSSWVGRYVVRSIDFLSLAFTPSVAYKVTDRLSIGAQALISYTKIDLRASVNTPTPGDGRLHIDSADQWKPGWGLGLLWEPLDGTRLGVAYKSELDLDDLEGDFRLTGANVGFTSDVELEFTLPQSVFVGLAQEVDDRLTLFLDYAWADFSEFDLITVDLSQTGLEGKTGFRDTVAYGVAAAYRLTPEWTAQAGISYASSPVSRSDRNPSLPFDRQVRYGAGVTYQWNETLDFSLSYEYLDLGDAAIDLTLENGDRVQGDYDTNRVQFIALTLRKSF